MRRLDNIDSCMEMSPLWRWRTGGLTFILLIMAACISGCAGIMDQVLPPPVVSPEAQQVLSMLENRNRNLKTFKGTGRIDIEKEEERRHARVAWIGDDNKRLRIGILSISGTPTVSIAADGEYFYAVSHAENKFYKTRSTDPGLKRAIGISMKTRTVIQLLSGRAPVRGHDSAQMITDEESGLPVLQLTSRWGRILEKVYFSEDRTTVHQVDMHDSTGGFVYRIKLDDFRMVGDYRMPFSIIVTGEDVFFRLRVDRYWADVGVDESVFVLEDPGSPS